MAWSRGGTWLAVKTAAGVDVIDVVTRKRIGQIALPGQESARLMVSSPDDRWLFVCAEDDTVTAIDVKSWRARPAVTLTSRLASLAFRPDGTLFATNTAGRIEHRAQSVAAQTQIWSLAGIDAPQVIAWRPYAGLKAQPRITPFPTALRAGGSWEGLDDVASWPSWVVEDEMLTSVDGQWQTMTSTDVRGRAPSVIHGPTGEPLRSAPMGAGWPPLGQTAVGRCASGRCTQTTSSMRRALASPAT
jgi:hypothetical protein